MPVIWRRAVHVVATSEREAARYLLHRNANADFCALDDKEDAEEIARIMTGKRPETFTVFSFVITLTNPADDENEEA